MKRRTLWLWASGVFVCAAVASLGPAGIASGGQQGPIETCNPSGRLFCITLSTFDGITASDPTRTNGNRYTWVEWQMSNDGGSVLTHPTITVTRTDYCGPSTPCASATSAFVMPASPNVCTSNAGTLTCPYANLPAGGSTPTTRIFFKTADVPATQTVISVRGTVKERANDSNTCGSGDPNCDTFTTSITNSYEPVENEAHTFALNGNRFHLAANDELSSFDFTSASPSIFRADFRAFGCPTASPNCFERTLEISTEQAPGFSASNPVVFYARLTNPASGVNANNVVAIHTYDDTSVQIIGDQSSERSTNGCTSTFSQQIPIPSICAKKVQGVPKTFDVWVWDSANGRVGFG